MQGLFQPQGAPASSASSSIPPQILSSAFRFFNPSRIIF
jgi:hypothetical protein